MTKRTEEVFNSKATDKAYIQSTLSLYRNRNTGKNNFLTAWGEKYAIYAKIFSVAEVILIKLYTTVIS